MTVRYLDPAHRYVEMVTEAGRYRFPTDIRVEYWAIIVAKVEAGELVIEPYAPPSNVTE